MHALSQRNFTIQMGIKAFPLSCTGFTKTTSLFLTGQVHTRGRNNPEMPLHVKHQCEQNPLAFGIRSSRPWCHSSNKMHWCQVFITTCMPLSVPCYLQRFLCLWWHTVIFFLNRRCSPELYNGLLAWKQPKITHLSRWVRQVPQPHLKHKTEIVTSSVLRKELYSLMIVRNNTEEAFSFSNCHLLIFKEDNKNDIIKQNA